MARSGRRLLRRCRTRRPLPGATDGSARALRKTALSLTASVVLGSCAVGPDFVRPDAPKVGRYTVAPQPTNTVVAEGGAQAFEEGKKIAADWWKLFGSARVDALVAESIEHNASLEAAQASLRRSENNLLAGYGIFFPQADATAAASRQSTNFQKVGLSFPSNVFNLFSLSATVTYTLDIFGGERRTLEQLEAQADVQRYALAGTYVMLTGNVVNTSIAEAGYRAQVRVTEDLIAAEQEQVRIALAQARAGTVPFANVLSVQSQLATTEATIPALLQKTDQAASLLATLVGQAPGSWKDPGVSLEELTLPRDLPVTLPSELVRQRPDVLTAEAQFHSSSAAVGIATAAMFPSVTLSGVPGVNNTSITSLFSPGSFFWSLGAGLTAPLFHGGELWFQRKAAVDAYQQSAATYRQTVLTALEQVGDTLCALQHDAEALRAQTEAAHAAEEALRLLQVSYQAGTANYLQVLTADIQYQQAKVAEIQARVQRLQDTVALYVALGGGWWNGSPVASVWATEQPQEVTP